MLQKEEMMTRIKYLRFSNGIEQVKTINKDNSKQLMIILLNCDAYTSECYLKLLNETVNWKL